ncbi:iron chelate uptake ABC transporter family permease subunit [Lipingzhangella sp. LS1_29]|uniref:Iron chelate uptake ABC transporter family permease subunit n=1 Tax=Lipingzhangella rawalii TaxID=2055835 RepID=A0ABU2H1E3_9ACTN|nr:iron chelate uptake ABC transporter family permease subunit [Lipingzhangella rawalii]MDS1269114.1 iron chelate uptake ABC transporter family permease subunit [Lipingzhangella rawalii]
MSPVRAAQPPRGVVPGPVLHRGGIAVIVHPRSVVACLALFLVCVIVGAASLVLGDYPVPLERVPAALAGRGEHLDVFFVQGVRLPRMVTALLVGFALGVAGAVFQSLTRNPLGSPDIIGFTGGAATGAVAVILVVGGTMTHVSLGAVAGGMITGLVVYLLAMKQEVQGYRLVLVGIGVNAMLLAVRDYLLTRAELTDAMSAQVWMVGSLNGRGWGEVGAILVGVVVLTPVLVSLAPHLRLMEMGADTARGLGVAPQRTQTVALLVATALTGAAIAVSGPISFVALAAPQLFRRLARTTGPSLVGAGTMGASLLVTADLLAQHGLPDNQLPVGVVTAVVGGSYLVWLLYREWSSGRA